MARTAKKEKALTPEERLAQALVPDVEQPYWVPENWCWVWHNSILDISGGSQPDKSLFAPEPKAGYTQLYQTRDYGEHPIPVFIPDKYATKTTVEGDILLARYGGSLGKVFKARAGAYNVALAKVIILHNDAINKELLYYYYLSHFYQDFCVRAAYGRSAQAGFNRDDLAGLMFPLPPFAEQQRIVDRIESLFAKLDEAKEKAQAVVSGFEHRKAAILHKAFTGELTGKWRLAKAIEHSSWENTTVGKCSELITKGASPKWQGVSYTSDSTQTLFVTSENVREGFFDWTKEKYLDNTINDIQKRSILHKGDVLVNIVGASIGRSAIFDRDCLANTNQAVCLVRVKDNLNNEYLCHYFNSPFALMYYDDNKVETARANISLTNISDMPISLPTLQEQIEIVRRLNELIERELTIKRAIEQVIDQIDSMKKSILARAFRGELGTNDPADESAEELLKRIL